MRTLILGLAAFALAACASAPASAPAAPDPILADVVIGDPRAPVEIVEYGSLLCGHCRTFWLETLPALRTRYIDTGRARLIYRDMPMPQTAKESRIVSALSRCAGREHYYALITDILQRQRDLADQLRDNLRPPLLFEIAAAHGLSRNAVEACLASPAITVYLDEQAARRPNAIVAFPSFLINGRLVQSGDPTEITRAIETALAGR
jgi:protein-disulfide isomerase